MNWSSTKVVKIHQRRDWMTIQNIWRQIPYSTTTLLLSKQKYSLLSGNNNFFILKWFSSPENKKLQKTLVVPTFISPSFLQVILSTRKNGLELAAEQDHVEANFVRKLCPRPKRKEKLLTTLTTLLMSTTPITAQTKKGCGHRGRGPISR